MLAWLIPLIALLTIAGIIGYRLLTGKKTRGYLAHAEYWVFTNAKELPDQTKLMDRMISSNPHNRPGAPVIGAREGMLFTDIRLHIARAMREKNPQAFRPDLVEIHCVPSKEILARLASSHAFIKCRYSSEVILKDTRHLQFLPHMADAISELSEGAVIYDTVSEQIWTSEDFHKILSENPNTERPESHIRVVWDRVEDGSFARTLGLRKFGITELKTKVQEEDNERLITGLLMRLAFTSARALNLEDEYEFDEFGDKFVIKTTDILDEDGRVVEITRMKMA